MTKVIDFNNESVLEGVYYGGDAGAKDAISYMGSVWMLKYPKTTRDLVKPQISYTTSPLSEYLGSKIYETLGIPVHETLLGVRNNKVVVACKDFTRIIKAGGFEESPRAMINKQLVPFHDLKNSFMSSDLESYSGTGSETLLDEVLATIEGQRTLKKIPAAKERFWDMFVIDAFIGNNDRNNGNWGILIQPESGDIELAPVYDNGNAFFNKRSIAQMEKRLGNEKLIEEDAVKTLVSTYKYTGLDNEGHRINPFTYIMTKENEECTAAVARFVLSVDMGTIERLIDLIPENKGNLAIMPKVQKDFYLELLHCRLNYLLGVVQC